MSAHRLPDGRVPVLISTHDEELIRPDAAAIADYVQRTEQNDICTAVAATLLRTRRVRRHRAVIRAADRAELIAGLQALAGGDEHPLVATSPRTPAARMAFVFPGQGSQWPGMAADAYWRIPAYRHQADRCAQAFAAAGLSSPLRYLIGDPPDAWSQVEVQGAQFTHAVSLTQVWRSCGIAPEMTVGHSLGEVAAAYTAGAIGLPEAVAVVAARATVVNRLPGRYGVAVLGVSITDAERMIAETAGWLEISGVNAASSIVVSGERDAVTALVRRARGDHLFVRELPVDFPAHTSALESLRSDWNDLMPAATFCVAPVEFIGSAGGVVSPETNFADYWYANLRNTVRFDRAVAAAIRRGAGAFIELSAHPALLYSLSDLVEDALIVGSGRRDEPIADQLSAGIAAAAVADPAYRWADLIADRRPLPNFPNAPMRAIHLWARPEPLPPLKPALTVAVEQWEPCPRTGARGRQRSPRSVAVMGAGSHGDALAQRLSDAVVAHPDCGLAAAGEAEIAVLVAPDLAQPEALADIDYRRAIGPGCRQVWLITTRGERVHTEEPAAVPMQAALGAMHRSAGYEFPDATFAHLDLPGREIDAQAGLSCVEVLLGQVTEVALRANDAGLTGYTRTLRERAKPSTRALNVPDDVVISGGSGAVGMRYARYCIEQGALRVILLSRKGIEQEDLSRLIGRHTAEVHAPACDITDRRAVAAVADEYGGTSLLVHAAGVARFGPHDQLTDLDFADVFDAKVTGLANLIELWPRRHDCRILLCSSVSGVWGGYGHAAYAAANRMLDALAAQLRVDGLDCSSVRWGLWEGTAIADIDEIRGVQRAGLVVMDPDAAISASLQLGAEDPLIFAANFDRLRVLLENQGTAASFAATREANADTDCDSIAGRSVAEVVRTELAAALRLGGPASVDLNTALVDLGVDSLLALDLRKRLRRGAGRSVPLAKLLGGITGAELIEALAQTELESTRD